VLGKRNRLPIKLTQLPIRRRLTVICAHPTVGVGRVGMWRDGVRLSMSVAAPFRLAVPQWLSHSSVSTPRSSNRTCGSPRIRLSDKTSRLRPRHVAPKPAQAYDPVVPVEVREWIAPAPSSPDFALGAQPPAQPHRCASIERPIRLADGSYLEIVRPSAQRAVHFAHQRCGLLPCSRSVGQRVDFLDHSPIIGRISCAHAQRISHHSPDQAEFLHSIRGDRAYRVTAGNGRFASNYGPYAVFAT
jgi:hypothetical protein